MKLWKRWRQRNAHTIEFLVIVFVLPVAVPLTIQASVAHDSHVHPYEHMVFRAGELFLMTWLILVPLTLDLAVRALNKNDPSATVTTALIVNLGTQLGLAAIALARWVHYLGLSFNGTAAHRSETDSINEGVTALIWGGLFLLVAVVLVFAAGRALEAGAAEVGNP